MRSSFLRYLSLILIALASISLPVSANEAFINQINDTVSQKNNETLNPNFSIDATQSISPTHSSKLHRSFQPSTGIDGTLSVISQRGRGNIATLMTAGSGNVTLQNQQGRRLTSGITLIGQRNAVAVDQAGTGLHSDIRIAGVNKLIVHVQRGQGRSGHHRPIVYTGRERQAELVVDTPRGRLTRPLTR